jgi:hypothetical protein
MRLPLVIAALTLAGAGAGQDLHALRVAKCSHLWRTMAPWSYRAELVDYFIGEHERAGIGSEWFYSLLYGHSGSGLVANMTYSAGGMTARGLMDCTETHLPRAEALRRFGTTNLHNPWVSIATHVRQTQGLRKRTGRSGMALMRSVFLPARPDSGRAWREQRVRWEPRAARMRSHLSDWYCTTGGKP